MDLYTEDMNTQAIRELTTEVETLKQKANNGGENNDLLIVNLTYDEDTEDYTIDKTFTEIKNAIPHVLMVYNDGDDYEWYLPPRVVSDGESSICFASNETFVDDNFDTYIPYTLEVWVNGDNTKFVDHTIEDSYLVETIYRSTPATTFITNEISFNKLEKLFLRGSLTIDTQFAGRVKPIQMFHDWDDEIYYIVIQYNNPTNNALQKLVLSSSTETGIYKGTPSST